jgi:hypothetical protein
MMATGAGECADGFQPSIKLSPDGGLCVLEGCFSEVFPPAALRFLPAWLTFHLGQSFAWWESNWEIRVYDVPAGREQRRLAGKEAAFSADGKTMAVVKNLGWVDDLDDQTTRLDLYDVPFHGPFGQCLAVALAAGLSGFLLAGRLSRWRTSAA